MRVRLVAVAVGTSVGLVIAAGAVAAWSLTRPSPDATCRPAHPPASGPAAPPAGLTVPEQALTAATLNAAPAASLGAMIANTTDRVAYHTTVTLRLTDATGAEQLWQQHTEIPVILPSHRVAVGALAVLPPAATPRLTVEIDRTHWVAPDAANGLFRPFDARPPAPSPSTTGPTALWLPPTGDHRGPCRNLTTTGAAQLFRDASGHLLGGANAGTDAVYCRGAHFGADVALTAYPAAADLSKTDVTVYCDLPGGS